MCIINILTHKELLNKCILLLKLFITLCIIIFEVQKTGFMSDKPAGEIALIKRYVTTYHNSDINTIQLVAI